MQQPNAYSGESRMHAQHRSRLAHLQTEADNLAGAARLISQTIAETLARGGAVSIQPQMAFLSGSMLRMMKDWGVIEQLQAQGTKHRPVGANGHAAQHPRQA